MEINPDSSITDVLQELNVEVTAQIEALDQYGSAKARELVNSEPENPDSVKLAILNVARNALGVVRTSHDKLVRAEDWARDFSDPDREPIDSTQIVALSQAWDAFIDVMADIMESRRLTSFDATFMLGIFLTGHAIAADIRQLMRRHVQKPSIFSFEDLLREMGAQEADPADENDEYFDESA